MATIYGAGSITAWAAATITGSFTTNSTYSGFARRVGDTLECSGRVTFSGAPNSTSFTIDIPDSLTVDETKTFQSGIVGSLFLSDTGVSTRGVGLLTYNTTSNVIDAKILVTAPTTLGDVTQAVPITLGSTDLITFQFSVPITGW